MQVHLVKTRLVNSYVIEDGERLLVVDVAQGGAKYVAGFIEDVLQRPCEHVDLIVCTHDDFDHIGGVFELARVCDAEVGVPYASNSMRRKLMKNPAGILYKTATVAAEATRPRMWDMYFNPRRNRDAARDPQRDVRATPSYAERPRAPDYRLKHDTALPGFEGWAALHTPGHSWDSMCYYHAESGSLITGDTLLGSKKRGEVVIPAILSNPKQLAQSLTQLRSLKPQHIYPGHGSVFHGHGLLDHLVQQAG